MKLKILISLFATLFVSQISSAKEFYADPQNGQVIFKASALGLRFEGKGQGVDGLVQTVDGVSGRLEFDLATLDTGIEMRNSHMKDNYLEVSKFPKSELTITRVAKFDENAVEQESDFEGLLTVRGIQKPIQGGKVKISKIESGYKVMASFDTKISDFSIPIPKYAGVVLKDDLKVEAHLTLAPKMK